MLYLLRHVVKAGYVFIQQGDFRTLYCSRISSTYPIKAYPLVPLFCRTASSNATLYILVIYSMARGLMQWAPLPEVGWSDLCHEAWGTDNHRHQHTWN